MLKTQIYRAGHESRRLAAFEPVIIRHCEDRHKVYNALLSLIISEKSLWSLNKSWHDCADGATQMKTAQMHRKHNGSCVTSSWRLMINIKHAVHVRRKQTVDWTCLSKKEEVQNIIWKNSQTKSQLSAL